MTELMLSLLGIALGVIGCTFFEQRRCRMALETARRDLQADREILSRASQANESLAQELTRQRDHLASLEMRLGVAGATKAPFTR